MFKSEYFSDCAVVCIDYFCVDGFRIVSGSVKVIDSKNSCCYYVMVEDDKKIVFIENLNEKPKAVPKELCVYDNTYSMYYGEYVADKECIADNDNECFEEQSAMDIVFE